MLGISSAESESLRSRPAYPAPPVRPLRAAPPLAAAEPGSQTGSTTKPQDQRRAIGTLWMLASIAVDAAILATVLRAFVSFNGRVEKSYGIIYLALSLAALLPTYRRGRVVVRPAESFVRIATRLTLTPILTAGLTLTPVVSAALGFAELVTATPGSSAAGAGISEFTTSVYLSLVGVSVLGVMASRVLMFKLIQLARRRGYDLEDTLIVGSGPVGVELAEALEQNPEFGLIPSGFVDRFDERLPYPIVGRPENLLEILEATRVRHVVLAFGAATDTELVAQVRRCAVLPVQFYTVPRFFELGLGHGGGGHEVDGFALVALRRPGRGHSMWPLKRALDLVVSVMLLVLSAPVMLLCALLVKRSSPGPVFFKQVRVGVNGRPFEIFKFRSMRVNDDHGTTWSVDEDQRVTKFGHFLRQSHLDELPQLLNVVRGEMSIVGPRPERPYFVEQFATEIDGYDHRHRVPAGITGWAQVNGYWGDTSIEARVRLDNRYIENWSPWRDLVITLRTIPTLLGRRR